MLIIYIIIIIKVGVVNLPEYLKFLHIFLCLLGTNGRENVLSISEKKVNERVHPHSS